MILPYMYIMHHITAMTHSGPLPMLLIPSYFHVLVSVCDPGNFIGFVYGTHEPQPKKMSTPSLSTINCV